MKRASNLLLRTVPVPCVPINAARYVRVIYCRHNLSTKYVESLWYYFICYTLFSRNSFRQMSNATDAFQFVHMLFWSPCISNTHFQFVRIEMRAPECVTCLRFLCILNSRRAIEQLWRDCMHLQVTGTNTCIGSVRTLHSVCAIKVCRLNILVRRTFVFKMHSVCQQHVRPMLASGTNDSKINGGTFSNELYLFGIIMTHDRTFYSQNVRNLQTHDETFEQLIINL